MGKIRGRYWEDMGMQTGNDRKSSQRSVVFAGASDGFIPMVPMLCPCVWTEPDKFIQIQWLRHLWAKARNGKRTNRWFETFGFAPKIGKRPNSNSERL